jgi:uncharacterized protein
MEAVLPDLECKRIIDEVIVPAFRKNDFDGGITSGVTAIINSILSKQVLAPAPQS